MRNSFESYRESEQVERQAQTDIAEASARIRDAQPVSDRPDGITNVDLNRINANDIKTPGDFKSPEQYAGMRREAGRLKQMQPALDQGANADTFDSWDQANRIGHYSPRGYTRGYVDAYHSYHGPEAVAVEPKADGTYDVINRQHRIAAARDAGLSKIPARVV
jgi:hypothetical protein